MTRANSVPLAGSTLILIGAVLFGPRSCDSGAGTAYLLTGVVALLACEVAPYIASKSPAAGRARVALRGVLICAGVWILGIALDGFRVMCRLF